MLPSDIHLENFSDLIENESISHISFDYVQETVSEMSWNNVLDTINATDIVEDQIYTGAGIRIGILEASGRCDDTHDTLSGIDITYNNDGTRPIEEQNISDHATKVTSILYTIAPDAEYYYDITANSADLSWFIDQYCDIINCSWGYTSAIKIADGQYAGATSNTYKMHQDGLYDYLVSTHFITVVKSAGNVNLNSTKSSYNPNALITNPGYAYNVITVGGVDFQSSNNPRLVHATLAAYESGSDSVKPNISAPFTVDIPGIGVDQGTSLSTPQVAASLALLYEAVPRLDSYPEIAMVLVTASAQETYDYSNDDGYIDEQVGTGVLNVSGMFDIAENGDYEDDATFGNQSEIFSIDIYLNEGDILQASTTWLVRIVVDEDGDPSEMYFTDYDLVIQDENQILLDSSVLWSNSNVEFIRYEAEADGLYTIVVDLWGDFNYGGSDTDFLAIAYSIK